MTLLQVIQALHALWRAAEPKLPLYIGEPSTINGTSLFSEAGEGTYSADNYADYVTHRSRHYLCGVWAERTKGEMEALAYIESLTAALRADPTLAGALPSGQATISGYRAGWIEVGKAKYRSIEFTSEVMVRICTEEE